jgi:cysteine synthase A
MFARFGVPYRSIDLDSVEYQKDNKGGDIRAAIYQQTGLRTIPQIFIGGEHIGGATEMFDAWREGRAQELLDQHGASYDNSVDIDPYSFLPGWLHSR